MNTDVGVEKLRIQTLIVWLHHIVVRNPVCGKGNQDVRVHCLVIQVYYQEK